MEKEVGLEEFLLNTSYEVRKSVGGGLVIPHSVYLNITNNVVIPNNTVFYGSIFLKGYTKKLPQTLTVLRTIFFAKVDGSETHDIDGRNLVLHKEIE